MKLARTAAGYVARTELFARIGLMAVDCTISPQGDLVVCCHTGAPDWGDGPKGEGRIFKISHTRKSAPQPVLAWPASETNTVITFGCPIGVAAWLDIARMKIESGRYADAADRLKTIRPGYAVVKMQQVFGTRLAGTDGELQIAQPGGAVAKLKKADISKTEPMTVSLLPAGLDKALRKEGLRDLMTNLLKEKP